MPDPRMAVLRELGEQLQYGVLQRNRLWEDYWREGRRMVTVPENRVEGVTMTGNTFTNTGGRLFPSFPNLAPKVTVDGPVRTINLKPGAGLQMVTGRSWEPTIRDCIARLKAARAKESTNRNLSTLLAVVVKVQHDLETLVGDDWKKDDAAVESQVTRDDRSV